MLGARLIGGIFMTGGFFLGPNDFYERLRSMPPQELAKIDMTRIDFINQLYGQARLKRAQRRKARFMNTTMIVTLLGAAASDALESGQVVSGVGGQYNFVAMAHALPDARLLMMLRATHDNKDGLKSSIVWNYGHVTIPRHLRDIVITEYGVADLRGQNDSEVVKRLIAVADSRFQDELVQAGQGAWQARTPTGRCPSATATTCRRRWKTSCTPGPRPGCCRTSRSAPTSPPTNCTSCAR
jgi:acyl-CoA hydrolase